jgi:hypothetical protein
MKLLAIETYAEEQAIYAAWGASKYNKKQKIVQNNHANDV